MRGFGDLEAVLMARLWAADGPRTVRDMHTELAPERPLAYTTVMTVMDKLHRKGWLQREPVGRAYAYRPTKTREQYTADLMSEALAASSDRSCVSAPDTALAWRRLSSMTTAIGSDSLAGSPMCTRSSASIELRNSTTPSPTVRTGVPAGAP